jgi:hypothetical protein
LVVDAGYSEGLDYFYKFLLKDFDALLEACVWFETPKGFDVDVETFGFSVVIEFFVFLWFGFLRHVVALRPVSFGIFLIAKICVLEFVQGIVFKANICCRSPLRILLRDSLLCNTPHLNLLSHPQLRDQTPFILLINNNRIPQPFIQPRITHNQIARKAVHDFTARTACVQSEDNGVVLAYSS